MAKRESGNPVPLASIAGSKGKGCLFDEWLYADGAVGRKKFSGHIHLEKVIGEGNRGGVAGKRGPLYIETVGGMLAVPLERGQHREAAEFLAKVIEQCEKQDAFLFRREGDEDHVIRVSQRHQEEMRRIPQEYWTEPAGRLDYVAVKGIGYHQGVLERMISGIRRMVELEREPDNPVSSYAVKVVGIWYDGEKWRREKFGYLPKEHCAMLVGMWPEAKYGATIETLFMPREGKSAGIRVNLCIDKEDFKKAELTRPLPEDAEPGHERTRLARNYEKRGEPEKAIALYQRNIEEQCESPYDFERLSLIYSKEGDLDKAIYYCDMFLDIPAGSNPAYTDAASKMAKRRDRLRSKLKSKGTKEENKRESS